MTNYDLYMQILRKELPIGESFDMLERKLRIGGRAASMFFVDGLTDGEKAQHILAYLMRVPAAAMEGVSTSQQFIETALPFLDVTVIKPKEDVGESDVRSDSTNFDIQTAPDNQATQSIQTIQYKKAWDCYKQALPRLYAGLVLLAAEGLDNLIIIDCRDYPGRSVEEPDKEQSLRGAKDGFTENMMDNVGMIRRRIRDNNLIFKVFNVGNVSKADVVVAYMNDRADKQMTQKVESCLEKLSRSISPDSAGEEVLSVADQSLLERLLRALGAKGGMNPFPKVRYTQRPDVTAAHIAEGKMAIIVDNSPTAMLIPVSIFEFFQDVDDYYFPQLTGNYFRLIRIMNFMVILFLTPVYLLITQYEDFTPEVLKFFVPEEDFAIPIFWQFLLLELAVDALKLASLNTPSSLGMSLSIIGALILGEFSINSGWFIAQTILCMAVVALAAFTQPSIELSYAMKFCRIFMLIGAGVFGIPGAASAAVISMIILATTKTVSGKSYLYPLVPFDFNALKRLLFRTQK